LLLPDDTVRVKVERLNSTVAAPKPMSYLRHTVLLWLAGSAVACLGQTNLTPALQPAEREGRIVVSDRQGDNLGLGPAAIDRQKLPVAIKERIQQFEASREAYLREQEAMKKRLLGASTEEERERVRLLMRDQREAWLRRAKAMREEARERVRELRTQLPSMNEVIENARENARDSATQIRKRRGQD
jgi:hypothetical protein